MTVQPMTTAFAPAERAPSTEIERQAAAFDNHLLTRHVIDRVPVAVMVLNGYRQIVLANAALLGLLKKDLHALLGLRPGEALICQHAFETPGGCGTTESCRNCGAVLSILAAQRGEPTVGECSVQRPLGVPGEDLDLRVHAAPLEVDGQWFTIFTASDIGHERRRRALERIFFHDILNTAGGLSGFAQLIGDGEGEQTTQHAQVMRDIAQKLIDEITSQKDLLAAESSELQVYPTLCGASEFLAKVVGEHANHPAARGRLLVVAPDCGRMSLVTDVGLLRRVLGNMIKNALEACRAGDTVTVGCQAADGDRLVFWVHNPGLIPRDAQLQLFNRSFSTKGPHRGLGTYSIRLLTTRYLQGEVGFKSTAEEGTRFFVTLPHVLK